MLPSNANQPLSRLVPTRTRYARLCWLRRQVDFRSLYATAATTGLGAPCATAASLRLHRVGQVMSGNIVFPWGDAPTVLERFAALMQSAPDELAGAVILSVGPDGNPLVVVNPIWSGDPERGWQIVRE